MGSFDWLRSGDDVDIDVFFHGLCVVFATSKDRLHNMRTLQYMLLNSTQRQFFKALDRADLTR